MTKKKIVTTLKSYEDVNKALFEIGKMDAQLKEVEGTMNKQILEVQNSHNKVINGILEKKISLEANIEAYCKQNKKDFTAKGQTKTKNLHFGIVKFKMNPGAIVLLRTVKNGFKKAAEDLKLLMGNKYIREIPEVNKEKLLQHYREKKIGDMELASVNLRVDQEDKFSYKVNWKKIEEEVGSQQSAAGGK